MLVCKQHFPLSFEGVPSGTPNPLPIRYQIQKEGFTPGDFPPIIDRLEREFLWGNFKDFKEGPQNSV